MLIAEESLVKVAGVYVHTADLLLTSPREAQGRKALEGKPELEVAFNYFSTTGHGKTGRQHSKQGALVG